MADGSILVVDDDEAYLWYVDEVLKTAGLSPTLCTSAYAAKKALAEGSFALVIADLMLPGSSGLDVLEAARQADPRSVGVIMTAFSSAEAGREAVAKGAFDFLSKPCPAEALLACVHRALEHALKSRPEGLA